MNILKILFPAMMVAGAAGSFITNIASHGEGAISLQWVGACLLYMALTIRNIRG